MDPKFRSSSCLVPCVRVEDLDQPTSYDGVLQADRRVQRAVTMPNRSGSDRLTNVLPRDDTTFGKHDGASDDVAKLANIPGPVVLLEKLEGS
jgi:hypothetical protein